MDFPDSIRKLAACAAVLVALAGLPGCEEETPAEKAGEAIEDTGEQLGDAVEDAGEEVQDAAD